MGKVAGHAYCLGNADPLQWPGSGTWRQSLRLTEARELAEEREELFEQVRGVAGLPLNDDRFRRDRDFPREARQRDLGLVRVAGDAHLHALWRCVLDLIDEVRD